MDRKSKILLGLIVLVTILSVTATFYRTVILQDFEIVGMGVEVDTNYTYAWFIYQDEEYEFEIDSHNYESLQAAVLEEIPDVESTFLTELKTTYEEAQNLEI